MSTRENMKRVSTGVKGLDTILDGGFPDRQFILIKGGPGTGKTTLALQFLLEGIRLGEKCLYVSLLQGRREIERMARSHGWILKGLDVESLFENEDLVRVAREQTVFHPVHVELGETMGKIRDLVERIAPDRLVFDSISELQILSDTFLRYRQQVAGLKRILSEKCTGLFTIGEAPSANVEEFEYVMDGSIRMQQYPPAYGRVRRVIEVTKMRGMGYRSGLHDFNITIGGIVVYPRLQTFHEALPEDKELTVPESMSINSGVNEFDTMVGGGLMKGTATLLVGPSGSGKSTLITLYLHAAAGQEKKSCILIFDESVHTFLMRARGIGIDLTPHIKRGLIQIRRINVGEISAGEFSEIVRSAIHNDHIELLAIDSISGYASAMGDQGVVLAQLHELLAYTGNHGVLTLIALAEHGFIGSGTPDPSSTTILADTVLLLRLFESHGMIRRAISIFKKRYGNHEKTIREVRITSHGVSFGRPLSAFEGILTGVPAFRGEKAELIESGE